MKILLKVEGYTPLLIASKTEKKNIVDLLFKENTHVNVTDEEGATALILACFNGHKDTVKLLLKNGAKD